MLGWFGQEGADAAPPDDAGARRAWWKGLKGEWPRWCRKGLNLPPRAVPTDAQLAELVSRRTLILDVEANAGVDLAPLGAFAALEELRVIGKVARGAERIGTLTTLRRLVLFDCGLASIDFASRLTGLFPEEELRAFRKVRRGVRVL